VDIRERSKNDRKNIIKNTTHITTGERKRSHVRDNRENDA